MSELDDLRKDLARHTQIRNDIVKRAEKIIKKANREYDKYAVPLARKIAALVPVEEPVRPVVKRATQKRVSMEGTEGWSPEEQAMYKQLMEGKK